MKINISLSSDYKVGFSWDSADGKRKIIKKEGNSFLVEITPGFNLLYDIDKLKKLISADKKRLKELLPTSKNVLKKEEDPSKKLVFEAIKQRKLVMAQIRGLRGGIIPKIGILEKDIVYTSVDAYHITGTELFNSGHWKIISKEEAEVYFDYKEKGRKSKWTSVADELLWFVEHKDSIIDKGKKLLADRKMGEKNYESFIQKLKDTQSIDPATLEVGDIFVDINGKRWKVVEEHPKWPSFIPEEADETDSNPITLSLKGHIEKTKGHNK